MTCLYSKIGLQQNRDFMYNNKSTEGYCAEPVARVEVRCAFSEIMDECLKRIGEEVRIQWQP
jgi:hypothetical protein